MFQNKLTILAAYGLMRMWRPHMKRCPGTDDKEHAEKCSFDTFAIQ